jgi:ACS family hexuronate transporter-like MFS transporter
MLDFITFYYLAAYVGSVGAGFVSGWLSYRGLPPFAAQVGVYAGCCVLTSLTVLAAILPAQPLLLAVLLLVACGSLGVYTAYLSLTQNMSVKHQGKISGLLSTIVWLLTAPLHSWFGAYLDRDGNFDVAVGVSGCLPMISLFTLLFLWHRDPVAGET